MRFATVRLVLMAAALTACAVEHEAAPPDDGVEAHAEQSNELDLRELWFQYGKLDLRAPWQRSCAGHAREGPDPLCRPPRQRVMQHDRGKGRELGRGGDGLRG